MSVNIENVAVLVEHLAHHLKIKKNIYIDYLKIIGQKICQKIHQKIRQINASKKVDKIRRKIKSANVENVAVLVEHLAHILKFQKIYKIKSLS